MKDSLSSSFLPPPACGAFAPLPATGPLGCVSALGLFNRLGLAHAQGRLLLENEGGQLAFAFQQGRLEATDSTWPQDRPERWLLANNVLAPMELHMPGFHIESWLAKQLASGKAEVTKLQQCLRSAAEQTLARALQWTQGSYAWQDVFPEVHVPLAAEDNWPLFLSAARALPEAFLRQHLKPFWTLPWRQGPCAVNFDAEKLPWQPAELEALHRLKLCKVPSEAVPHVGELALYSTVSFVLWQADIWVPTPTPKEAVVASPTESPTEEAALDREWAQRLKATQKTWEGEDAFFILGVAHNATPPEIKHAYFALVRQFHPDKLPPEVSEATKKLATDVFAQLGAAYRCLSNEEERSALLSQLAGDKHGEPMELEALLAAESLFRKAARMVASRRFADALPLLQEALQLNPGAAECWAYLGYAKYFLPQHGETAALADLEKAKQQNPAFPDTYYFMGRLARLRKEAALAKALFEQCLALEPQHVEAQQELRLLK